MFSKFKELFSSESLLDAAYKTTVTMLEYDFEMYEAARKVLREQHGAELPFDIKQMDRRINKFEREVRRNVLTHLTIAGTTNLVPGLVLVSIVISVERIGDYTKNITELARDHEEKLHGNRLEQDICTVEAAIAKHFPMAIDVIKTQDKEKGREIMHDQHDISKTVDRVCGELVSNKHSDMASDDAASIALYVRYLKRINSHLTTIASSIVNPFPRIGFREKTRPPEEN